MSFFSAAQNSNNYFYTSLLFLLLLSYFLSTLLDHCLKSLHNPVKVMNLPTDVYRKIAEFM